MMQLPIETHTQIKSATPILKWAGGKSSLLKQFTPHFPAPHTYKRYFEPFIGGAAVFFSLQPKHSYLYDLNADLIELYTLVRDDVESVIKALDPHHNDRAYFENVRALDPLTLNGSERAARFIFLNRTCFNGLYRVNSHGQFNVPFGKYKNPTICDAEGLRTASLALQQVHLEVADF